MKLQIIFTLTAVLAVSLCTHAESVDSKVLAISGYATVQEPGQEPRTLTRGEMIPQGSEITTFTGSKVVLGLVPGAGSIIEPDSQVSLNKVAVEKTGEKIESRSVELGLKNRAGSVISFLDNEDGLSEFAVRTPTGVAAARGTVWRTTGDDSIEVVNGTVTFSAGGTTLSVPAGFGAANGEVTQLSDAQIQELVDAINNTPGYSGQFDPNTGTLTITNEDGDPLLEQTLNPVTTGTEVETAGDDPYNPL